MLLPLNFNMKQVIAVIMLSISKLLYVNSFFRMKIFKVILNYDTVLHISDFCIRNSVFFQYISVKTLHLTRFPPFPFSSAYLGYGPGIYQEGSKEG